MVKVIACHPYFKIERVLSAREQNIVVHERMIRLYPTKITTFHREFLISNVHDVSFRKLGGDEGILYLHTNQGVYPYTVKEDPALFIQAYKEVCLRS